MTAPQVKVEIRFDGVTWVDVSSRVLLAESVYISRGRESEAGEHVPVGTCSLTLHNDDGAFSPDLPTATYYPYVVKGVHIRVQALANSLWLARFYGTIQSWKVDWLDETGLHAVTRVTANDALASLPSYTFRQAADEAVRHLEAVRHHWPLRDTEGPAKPMIGSVDLIANAGTGWDTAPLLAMDEGGAKHPLMKSAAGGITLTAQPDSLGTGPWTAMIVLTEAPTANCTILSGFTGATGGGAAYSLAMTGGALQGAVPPDSYPCLVGVRSTGSGAACNYFAVSATELRAQTGAPLIMPKRIVLNPTLSGGAQWGAAHMILCADYIADTPLYDFAHRLLGPRTQGVEFVQEMAGGQPITGSVDAVTLPALEGRDAAEVMAALVKGTGARLVALGNGFVKWVRFGGDPLVTLSLPSLEPGLDIAWQTDDSSWLSDVTVTWPDGASYLATRPDGERKSDSIEGVHYSRSLDRSYADWLVHGASSGARMPMLPVDMMALTEAEKADVCATAPSLRVAATGLPPQMPTSVLSILEGLTEVIAHQSWDIVLKLSPDVHSRLFILDDPVQGVLDSSYILAP